ncbi:hypothetical protein DSLPV1_049 [Dishui lake phycodnavirus 1]|uniref:hypothetical protein n=1 Tax=Dishui lake phycodnavirus 1 TaxID=2079134 RepID=UPI000CD690CA|nr:hypothetical protein C5Y57_gp049 [Dishui lake phycodnavirus 1]AUT19020.1 hypothetical protein DSLPV1_049 [Dishui lake phycodnavirus 1]
MFLLLCKPALVVPPPYVGIDYCRVVEARPTAVESTYEITVLEAPKIYMDEDSTTSGFFNTIASSSGSVSGKSTSFKPFDSNSLKTRRDPSRR